MRRAVFLLGTSFLLLPCFLLAQELQYPQLPGISAPHPGISLEELVRYLYHFSLILGTAIAVGVFIYGGILFLTSLGNPFKIAQGKERMTSAIFGLLVLFASYLILSSLDPHLLLFRISPLQIPPPPQVPQRSIPKEMPVSYTQYSTFKEDSEKLDDFLFQELLKLTRISEAPAALLNTAQEATSSLKCENTQTICAPKCLEGVAVSCKWEEESPFYKLSSEIEETRDAINQLKTMVEELVKSEEAKDVRYTLNSLEKCEKNLTTRLLIHAQAQEEGILDYFNISQSSPLDFYCLSY